MSTSFIRGPELPNTFRSYDVKVDTFTVAAGATGFTFEIPNTRMVLKLNPAKNTTPVAVGAGYSRSVLDLGHFHISALCATNSTDSYAINLQYSTDDGATWTDFSNAHTDVPPNEAGHVATYSETAFGVNHVTITGAITNNQILIRLVVVDGTSPTTNIFTITNIRASAFVTYMA